MRKMTRLLALSATLAYLSGCAALPGLAAAFGMAAPVVSAFGTQLQRAQALAPGLSPQRPDDAALLAELVRRLDNFDYCQANAQAALAPAASSASAPSDAARTTSALLDAAEAIRGLIDAVRAAQPASPASVLPLVVRAAGPGDGGS